MPCVPANPAKKAAGRTPKGEPRDWYSGVTVVPDNHIIVFGKKFGKTLSFYGTAR
jgi:hypothetical protein